MSLADNFARLRTVDTAVKPSGAKTEWEAAWRAYEDVSRSDTISMLSALGAGIKNNTSPLEVVLMRRMVDRLAVVYAKAPTRWWMASPDSDTPIDESGAQHREITRALERSKYDLVLRRVDRLSALLRNVAVRLYPSDVRGAVLLQPVLPTSIMREPSDHAPDMLDEDVQFAIQRGSVPGASGPAAERWEHWTRNVATNVWSMAMVDGSGQPLPKAQQPFASTNLINPYPMLPVQMFYDDEPAGRAWLPPRFSRTAWVRAINAMANDLWALILNEAHTQKVVNTDDTKKAPKTTGPNVIWALGLDDKASVLSQTTQIAPVTDTLESFVRMWTLSEDLPATEFDRTKQQETGAALRVHMEPLLSRRRDLVPLAVQAERQLWQRYMGVHNVHASAGLRAWAGVAPFPDGLTVDVEIADLEVPTDIKEVQGAASQAIVVGTGSTIDMIQAERGCSRAQAIRIYERVQRDMKAYPPRAPEGALANGQDPSNPVPNSEARSGTNSQVQAARKSPDPGE